MPDELLADPSAVLAYVREAAHAGAVQMESLRNAALVGLHGPGRHQDIPDLLGQLETAVQCHLRYLASLHATTFAPVEGDEEPC